MTCPFFCIMMYEYHYHECNWSPAYGDWRIHSLSEDNNLILPIQKIEHLLTEDKLQLVQHKDIAWKGKHLYPFHNLENCVCCEGKRYASCDIKYPGIITEGHNPYDNKYRMIDGKHRMQKMRYLGMTQSQYYLIPFNELIPFIIESPYG